MPVVQAYQCSETGKLFAITDKKKYLAHCRKVAAERRAKKKIDLIRETFSTKWEEFRNRPFASFDELAAALIEEQELLWDYIRAFGTGFAVSDLAQTRKFNGVVVKCKPRMTKLKFCNMTFSPTVSNTHSAPFGGVTNWGCKPNKPRGYPGWRGSIVIVHETHRAFSGTYFGSALFEKSGINTGTGGGGGGKELDGNIAEQNYRYDVILYAQDWPGLFNKIMAGHTWDALSA